MIRPYLYDEGDLAVLEVNERTDLEKALLEQVRWYRHVLKKMEHCMANAETIEEAWDRFEDLDASVF